MSAVAQSFYLTVEEYLAGEEQSAVRHEYIRGIVQAMAGGSRNHNLISGSLFAIIRQHFRGSRCQVFGSDMKARLSLSEGEFLYYPDMMVTCDPRDTHSDFNRFPKLIVEVLSESTEGVDRREKFWNYTQIETLEEYLLLAQDRPEPTIFRRESGWKAEVGNSLDETIHLHSVHLTISLRDIYEGVRF